MVSSFAAQCDYVDGTLTTFNRKGYRPIMPLGCPQVVVQDCTEELKFIVMQITDYLGYHHMYLITNDQ